jgi:HSP20 family molecular chaperone IbpA
MFNQKNKKTMYTKNLNSLFELFEPHFSNTPTNYFKNDYDVQTLDDGKVKLTVNVLGHNPKNIKLQVTDDTIDIQSTKEEGSSRLVRDINTTFSIGKDYDGTKTEAKFENGLLIITIDKKDERKSKLVKIAY